jgi:hypothetical protein
MRNSREKRRNYIYKTKSKVSNPGINTSNFAKVEIKGKKKRRGAPRKRESSFFNLE